VKFIIFGGGCYGTFYARQLLRARAAGALVVDDIAVIDHSEHPRAAELLDETAPLRIVQADWADFLDTHFAAGAGDGEHLVPPPFTPHLAVGWLLRSLERMFPDAHFAPQPFAALPGTPFQDQRAHGTLAVSHADWLCPVNCIEPARCPATRGPRDWDMDRTVRFFARDLDNAGQPVARVCLFHCHHLAWGVGTYPAQALVDAREALRQDIAGSKDLRFLVGTVSRCHGALHLVHARRGMDSVSGNANLEHDLKL
jgi:hypothetical protein